MSIRALKTLLWIRDGRSFQETARELNMTLSAVSMQMKQLEATYQVALFDRSTRPPRLTREGLTLADASRDIVTAYEDLPIVLRTSQPLSGKLALGVVATASIRLLPAVAQHLMSAFPQLKLRVESALSIDLENRVADGQLDAAVVTGTEDLGNAFAVTPILVEPLVLVAAKSERRQLSIKLLRTRPLIRFPPRTGIGQLIDAFLADRSIEIREGMVLDSLEAIVELVALNMGVAIIPEPEARRYGQGRVVWTESLGRPLNRTLALITRRTSGSLVLHDPAAAKKQVGK
jgi:DNA-binding transcriptional LysR family regulator